MTQPRPAARRGVGVALGRHLPTLHRKDLTLFDTLLHIVGSAPAQNSLIQARVPSIREVQPSS